MGNTLIIAEKPSVASNIASALGASKKDGYFEGSGYKFVAKTHRLAYGMKATFL